MRPVALRTAFCLLVVAGGCPGGRPLTMEDLERVRYDALSRFESEDDFEAYTDEVRSVRGEVLGGSGFLFGCAADEARLAASAGPADESITNNQVQGVDEGDIVKAVGDYFVILRRGRLFSVRQRDAGEDTLAAISVIDAQPPGFTQGTWYDEILVHEDRIVMIGYSYQISATEIGEFRIDASGQLSHLGTHFVSSNDYYSSRNYASRLVDGKLVLYMPSGLFSYRNDEVELPTVQTWRHGDELSDPAPLIAPQAIYRPIQGAINPALHTVLTCDLDGARFDCDASGVIGPFGRTFYVSRDAVYLWVSDGGWDYYYNAEASEQLSEARRERGEGRSVVYRLPLDGATPTALRAFGQPIDQFSFHEGADGYLNVVLTDAWAGDWMWSAEQSYAAPRLALMRAPLSIFDHDGAQVASEYFRPLDAPPSLPLQNRFVGDHLLWAEGSAWSGASASSVFVTPYAASDAVTTVLDLTHGVERIEVMGDAAVVVGQGTTGLGLSAIELATQPPFVADTYLEPGANQGETRSHGFFFQPAAAGGGVLGLPIRLTGGAYSSLWYGSAEVLYLSVSSAHHFEPLGTLTADAASATDDGCQYSCVDWYGNARPIFYRGRVFALLGYELVEGSLDGTIEEVRRIDFSP
ncbi:MAG: beta-propeller domain-containing protein [Deltaproteobacteria bacterium]|nr:beta-propeller domain-containing protein [Deltaproteobacteria bacterium]